VAVAEAEACAAREEALSARRRPGRELADDLESTQLLRELGERLVPEGNPQVLYAELLQAAIRLSDADAGTLQLLDEASHELVLLVTHGFDLDMTEHFHRVDAASDTSCGLALSRGRRTVVHFDDPDNPDPHGDLRRHVAAGYRSGQSTPLHTRSGQPIGMISTHWREHRVPTEREMRFLDLLARQAADLIERKKIDDALRAADQRKDEFLATLAHELRNPLAPLRHGIQIARKSCGAEAMLRPVIDMMDRQLSHLVRLVDDLLDVGRIQSGTLKLRKLPVALNDVIVASAEAARAFIEARGHVLQITPAAAQPVVMADFDRLVQVFTHLLSNAAKFSPQGSTIRVYVESCGTAADVRVVDRGIGIGRDDLPHVFDLFSQVRLHQGHTDGGLGVGLAIVRSLVALHGGMIRAESAGLGAGSTFSVSLPVTAPRQAPDLPSRLEMLPSTSRRRRILVVDDNVDGGDSLAALLQMHGQEVAVARDGVEAVREARTFRPEVILLDIGMPRMDGCEAARRIRALPGGQSILIVAMTGWGQAADRQRTRDAGFDRHLVKPVDEATLLDVLEADRAGAH
jgi:signal transduction histidine kinase/ActR/RegA family two-component response regulator